MKFSKEFVFESEIGFDLLIKIDKLLISNCKMLLKIIIKVVIYCVLLNNLFLYICSVFWVFVRLVLWCIVGRRVIVLFIDMKEGVRIVVVVVKLMIVYRVWGFVFFVR